MPPTIRSERHQFSFPGFAPRQRGRCRMRQFRAIIGGIRWGTLVAFWPYGATLRDYKLLLAYASPVGTRRTRQNYDKMECNAERAAPAGPNGIYHVNKYADWFVVIRVQIAKMLKAIHLSTRTGVRRKRAYIWHVMK